MTTAAKVPTAAIIVIGDEILSGRTKDKNVGHIAERLTDVGIDLNEVRVVADVQSAIVEAVNDLRGRNSYVFTTGGIGPTHDDITADAIAAAFDVPIDHDLRAVALLEGRYGAADLTAARLRMARIPDGAALVENPVSTAPGFRLENVYVMAGVPNIMQAMLENILPELTTGPRMLSTSLPATVGEGKVVAGLKIIQDKYETVAIGSYPKFDGEKHTTTIVLRSRDSDNLARAAQEVEMLLVEVSAD
jgi:molybdenum cofactor synthesis domain-containing protein